MVIHTAEIALEAITELGLVDLKNCPVLCEVLLADTEINGGGVKDAAKGLFIGFLPVLAYLFMQHLKCQVSICDSLAFSTSAAAVPISLSLNPGIHWLQHLTKMVCPLILWLIELRRLVNALLLSQEDIFGRPTGMVNVVNIVFLLGSEEDMVA
jgi:hypothetical protein